MSGSEGLVGWIRDEERNTKQAEWTGLAVKRASVGRTDGITSTGTAGSHSFYSLAFLQELASTQVVRMYATRRERLYIHSAARDERFQFRTEDEPVACSKHTRWP